MKLRASKSSVNNVMRICPTIIACTWIVHKPFIEAISYVLHQQDQNTQTHNHQQPSINLPSVHHPVEYHIMNGLQLVHHAGSCIGHCRATRLEMDHFCSEQNSCSARPTQEIVQSVAQEEKWPGCCDTPPKTRNVEGELPWNACKCPGLI